MIAKKQSNLEYWQQILREYLIKGFALDDNRFKNGNKFDREYFKELLEMVKSIRASERQIWMQITDIFAEVAVDYDSKSITTRQFFSMIQNKFIMLSQDKRLLKLFIIVLTIIKKIWDYKLGKAAQTKE